MPKAAEHLVNDIKVHAGNMAVDAIERSMIHFDDPGDRMDITAYAAGRVLGLAIAAMCRATGLPPDVATSHLINKLRWPAEAQAKGAGNG
jgi:hypothetical protein